VSSFLSADSSFIAAFDDDSSLPVVSTTLAFESELASPLTFYESLVESSFSVFSIFSFEVESSSCFFAASAAEAFAAFYLFC